MTGAKILDLTARLQPKSLGPMAAHRRRRKFRAGRGFTARDVALLVRAYFAGPQSGVEPARGEKAAAVRLVRVGLLGRREGDEQSGLWLSDSGFDAVAALVLALEMRRVPERPER